MSYLTDGRVKFNHSTICHQVAENADKWKSDIIPEGHHLLTAICIDNQASSEKDIPTQHGVLQNHGPQVQLVGPQALQPWILLHAVTLKLKQ